MEARSVTASGGRAAKAPRSRFAVLGATAAIIAALAFLVNQPSSDPDGFTSVTVSGDPRGERPEVGKVAPDFVATTVDGRTVQLSDLAGKPLWLTFGASWCQPCRAENPDIQATFEDFSASGLMVLAVFISEDAATVREYADRVGLTYRKIADPDSWLASRYRIVGIASHFFIDDAGVLRLIRIGSLDPPGMESALQAIVE